MRVRSPFAALVLLLTLPLVARARDWPMYRYDANRSAASPEELPAVLHHQWGVFLGPAKPAWPEQPKMQLDSVHEPVVAGQTLFLGSTVTDSLTAYDTRSSNFRWRFHAEGPIRYAPAVANGKVFVASDDGYLYCLDAAKGTLHWKFRGGPSDRKILGNERLISTWPARGAPVVADGKVYFAASIWPFMGIFIHCLDAETGKVVWTNDGDGSMYMKQPHNTDSFAGVAPQGPMVISGDYLLVPGGRSIPAVFDRKTGKWLRYQLAENGKKGGGAQVAAIGKYFFNGGSAFLLDSEKHLAAFGDPVVLTPDIGYGWAKDVLRAYDLKGATSETVEETDKNGKKIKVTKWKVKELAAVQLPKVETFIKAGKRLYVGRPGEVLALDLPLNNGEAKPSWRTEIRGEVPASLVAADDRLFVMTRQGKLYCFGGDKPAGLNHGATIHGFGLKPQPTPAWVDNARQLLESTKIRSGYCVVWGVGSGNLVFALAQQSDLRIIVIDPDPVPVKWLRDKCETAGWLGDRVTVHTGDPATFPLPPYLANLMVSEDFALAGVKSGLAQVAFMERAFQSLRPYGGTAVWPVPAEKREALAAALKEAQWPGAKITATPLGLQIVREGALAGAGNWTHEHGDAANTRVAKDQIVKAPLGLLWFGGPSHDGILPRHGHGPQPQVINGRCIIEGTNLLRAIDIYTGRLLWETELPGIGFFYDNLLHQPGANASGGNYVCTSDGIYAVHGARCVRLDPATGKQMAEFTLPSMGATKGLPRWGYINVEGDLLVGGADPIFDEKLFKEGVIVKDAKGLAEDTPDQKPSTAYTKLLNYLKANNDNWSSSRHLVVMDRHTGKVLWTATAKMGFRHNAICVGGGRLYAIDRISGPELARLKRKGEEPKIPARLVVFDAKTGKELWSTDKDVFGTWLSYSAQFDVVVEAGRVARDTITDEPKGMRAYIAGTGKVLWFQPTYTGPAMIHGRTVLQGQRACDLLSGELKMRPHPLTGVPVPWEWARNYGCNTPAASENLLTFRSGAAGYFDLCNDGGTGNFGGFRSSCTNNLIVAGGVICAPEYTRTCTCLYQNQTSVGLIHMPEAEMWTSFGALAMKGTIQQAGINLGGAGDRRADNGTLWLEYPSIGGKSPTIDVKVTGKKLEWYRHHASTVEGPLNWVTSSGVKGLASMTVKLSRGSLEGGHYTVRLYFAEPDGLKAGERVFSVAIQGKEVVKDFDIVKESGGGNRTLMREFTGIAAIDELTLTFRATTGAALLCGVEILAEPPKGKK
jgi:outer membrane protein assembly factor BamB